MPDIPTDPAATETFELRFELPLRALLIASVGALVGAALVVLWSVRSWSILVPVLGLILLVLALGYVAAALLAAVLLRQTLVLAPDRVTVANRRGRRSLTWSEVHDVRLAGPRLRLVPRPGQGKPLEVVNPGRSADATFGELLQAVQSRLDADRGYRNVS